MYCDIAKFRDEVNLNVFLKAACVTVPPVVSAPTRELTDKCQLGLQGVHSDPAATVCYLM